MVPSPPISTLFSGTGKVIGAPVSPKTGCPLPLSSSPVSSIRKLPLRVSPSLPVLSSTEIQPSP
ncbi:Uncharacterised protein [Vibrio cholerae]|uniref:Uncharacterized protein n=1 Tax=Vibrio cholerae TaxID=666 RepID=A0A655P6W4_VIBCL|nr:Uncharacterised protein [Vibrio cholerae]CSI52794.1 Uncharacterised protein [Vibrio cholerae]